MLLHATKRNSDSDPPLENASLPHQKRGGISSVGANPASTFFHFRKGIKMNSNQKGGGSKQGSNQGSSKQSGSQGSSSGSRGSSGGTQGGTHEQHVEAGRQSHKNDGKKQSGGSGNQDR
jgi:hypothetical protein